MKYLFKKLIVFLGLNLFCVFSFVSTNVKADEINEIVVIDQPHDIVVQKGEYITVSVKAKGNGLTYQWQYKYKNMDDYTDWGKGDTFVNSYPAFDGWDGMKYRCIITDANGNSVISEEATVYVTGKPEIEEQPHDIVVQNGEYITVSVKAKGNGLIYQWQYKYKNMDDYTDWGKGDTFVNSYPAFDGWDGMKYRCIITDANGNSVISKEAMVYIKNKNEEWELPIV